MHRCIPLFLLICLAVPLAESAPKKGGDKLVLYLPTTVGDKRVIESTWNGKTTETTEWVTAVETKDGMTVVSYASEEGGPTTKRYGASANGMFRVSAGTVVWDPPYRLLKLPPKEGETWECDVPAARPPHAYKYTTVKEEEVEVPAGKFKAVRVEEWHAGSGALLTTYWHAPGAGMVKIVTHDQRGDRVQVLKAFIPAVEK